MGLSGLWRLDSSELVSDQDVDHRVKVVEERQEVESHLGPALVHRVVQRVSIHDRGGIVKTGLKDGEEKTEMVSTLVIPLGRLLYRHAW